MPNLRNGFIYLSRGSNGSEVTYIQAALNIKADSIFGAGTERAVKAFQHANELGVDGVVGPVTFTAIMNEEIEIKFNRTLRSLVIQLTASNHSSGISQFFRCRAISGLPANHRHIRQLIGQGREDLQTSVDYMDPQYDDVSDVGPIPDGSYQLPLRPNMPYERSGQGWGIGGWYLNPGIFDRFFYRIGASRGGFFLHHDGNGVGTGGCIGVSRLNRMISLRKILIEYQKKDIDDSITVSVI